jgi:butyryl-CoA dehydrogenase
MAIDFTLTPAQRALQRETRSFAHDVLTKVGPAVLHLPTPEERADATRPFYEQLVAAGFLRKCIPVAAGGECTSLIDAAVLCEEFYSVDVNVTTTLIATVLGLYPVLLSGTPEQVARFIPPFLETRGAPLATFCSSEPGGSANAGAPPPAEGVRTSARKEQGSWVINGRKQWVPSPLGWDGKGADLLTVVCRTDPDAAPAQGVSVIAVPRPAEGLVFEHAHHSVGHRAHLSTRFRLENVTVPLDNVLGGVGNGLKVAEAAFTATAALVGVLGVAIMRAAFEFSLNFAKTQKRGGLHPIIEHQAVGYALADAKTALEAARFLSWSACAALDANAPGAPELAFHAKIFCSETAVKVLTDLMRVVGIDSYDHDLPLAGWLQDALVLPIFDGGNMGVRRRQLHGLLKAEGYDPLTAWGGDKVGNG